MNGNGTSRGQLMERLIGRGIDNPERLTSELDNEAIEGALRWYDQQTGLGRKVGSGLLAAKLRDGGFAGFGVEQPKEPKPWYQNAEARAQWCDEHFPNEPDEAEAAVISLNRQHRQITVDAVAKLIQVDRGLTADFYAHGSDFERRMAAPGNDRDPWISFAARRRG